jgi:GDP-D-mannose 3',5'-epimerase
VICSSVIDRRFDEIYQLAADMGGADFVFTGENDADIMHNSALINLNILDACHKRNVKRIFYSSSACIYPEYNQLDADNPKTAEDSAYPAAPASDYGWEKRVEYDIEYINRWSIWLDLKILIMTPFTLFGKNIY